MCHPERTRGISTMPSGEMPRLICHEARNDEDCCSAQLERRDRVVQELRAAHDAQHAQLADAAGVEQPL